MAFKFEGSAEDYAKLVSTDMLKNAFEEYDFDIELKEEWSISSSFVVTDIPKAIDSSAYIQQYNNRLNRAFVDAFSQQKIYAEFSKSFISGTQVNLGKPMDFVQKAIEMIAAPFYKHHLSNSKSFIDIENTTQDVDHYTNVKAKC